MQLPDPSPVHGKILDHAAGLGAPDAEMVEQRARELASIAGLSRDESPDDFQEQAQAELRGAVDPNVPNDDGGPLSELTAEDDVIGESGGPVASGMSNADEQTIGEQLYNEGIEEADHDRMTSSRREEAKDES